MFFEAKDGRSFPTSRIAAIHPARDGVRLVAMTDGEVVEAAASQVDALSRRVLAAFAAQPDTYLVSLDADEAGGRVWKAAVIGWRLTEDGKAHPVTADGGSSDAHIVLTPDGKVTQSDGIVWKSLDDWVMSVRRQRAA